MDNKKTYIKINEDDHEPSMEELMLDTDDDLEYTTPYTDNDNFDYLSDGESYGLDSIFDDR